MTDEKKKSQRLAEDSGAGKPKRGAPILPDEEKRTARYMLHMTPDEKATYMKFAAGKRMKLAEFLRAAADEYMTMHGGK